MSYKWDDKLTEKFLTLYRKHQCLWNPYSPNYRNCSVKNEAFKIVVRELNVPQIRIPECLQQIEVIREKYKQEQSKVERKIKSGRSYTSEVPWFNLMSQMLCEVINDEENFSEDPVRIVPCTVAKDEQNRVPETASDNGESSNLLYEVEKYIGNKSKQKNPNTYIISKEKLKQVDSGSEKTLYEQSQINDLLSELRILNDTKDLRNKCPFCGWDKEKNNAKIYDKANQFNYCIESGVQINCEIEAPLQLKRTEILDTGDNIEESNHPTPSILCVNEMNYSNRKGETPEIDVRQNRKKLKINARVEPSQDYRSQYVSTQPKKCPVTEDMIPYRNNDKLTYSLGAASSEQIPAYYPRINNVLEKNHIMCPNHIDYTNQNRGSKNQLPNFETDQTSHCISEKSRNSVLHQNNILRQSEEGSECECETDEDKNICASTYKSNAKFAPKFEKDKYEVFSRFKIIIPTSHQEDQNLEITGYEVRVINQQLSKDILCPSTKTQKMVIANPECGCENVISVSNRNANVDSARYNSTFELDVNHKHLKEIRTKKQSCSYGAKCMKQKTDFEYNSIQEIDAQRKLFLDKKIQTDNFYENESIQAFRNLVMSKYNYSKCTEDQGRVNDTLSTKERFYRFTDLDDNRTSIQQEGSILKDDSVLTEKQVEKNSSSSVGKFDNTRIFLNIIVKILESDDTQNKSENLQTTLDTMLHKFQQMPMNERSITEHYTNNNYKRKDTIHNDALQSTQYQNLPLNLPPTNQKVENKNLRASSSNNNVLHEGTTTKLRSQTVEIDDPTPDLRSQFSNTEEINDAANVETNGSQRNPGSSNETNKSIDEGGSRNGPQFMSLPDDTNTSNPVAESTLDYTNEFLNDEPVASSSRKIIEHRSPSQLAKDFLDVIKYTMMMDEVLSSTENGNNNCYRTPK